MANEKPKVNRLIAGTELIFCTVEELIPLFPNLNKKKIKQLLNFPNYTYKVSKITDKSFAIKSINVKKDKKIKSDNNSRK